MIRTAFAAATLLFAIPAAAQSQQEALDARYDRALAAGYKALMLCSAIASSEATGMGARTPESVHEWELTGIQQPLDTVIRELPYEIVQEPGESDSMIIRVEVTWAADMPPRFALNFPGSGCGIYPIGMDPSAVAAPDFREHRAPAIEHEFPEQPSSNVRPIHEAAFDGTYGEGSRTTVTLIRKDGKFVDWAGASGFSPFTPQRTWSVAKSIAATVVGAAVQRGETKIEDSAGLGEGVVDPRHAITIDHALRMASGRYSDTPGNRTDPLYWGGTTVDERAQTWPLIAEPGSIYRYANNDTLAAIKAIERTFEANPPQDVLRQIGMNNTFPETDWQGNYILSSQVWTTANDLARFGQLYLDDGKLPSGERILPEGWVQYVSTPSGPQPDGPFGYGAGFWLMNRSDGVPADTFAAFGNRGQYVVIVPSRNVVIVRRGEDPVGSGFDIAGFTRDVLAAVSGE